MVTMEKEKMAVNQPLVRTVSIVDTVKSIPEGKSALYTCQVLGNYMTVYSAIRRMNERLGHEQYKFESNDNGATFIITNRGASGKEVDKS